jgi:glycosyltransferase 2 family protein
MKHIKKNRIFISILLITLFYIIFTIFSDIDKIKNDYENFNIFYFLPILPILFLSMFFRSLIQKYLLKKLDIDISIKSSFMIFLGGYSMIMTPGGVGLIIKSYLIEKKYGHKISKSIPLVFAERFYDVLAVQIIILMTIFVFFLEISIILSIISISALSLAVFLIKNKKFNHIIIKITTKLKILSDNQDEQEKFLEGLQIIFELKLFLKMVIAITAIVLFEGIIFYLSFQIFGINIEYVEAIQTYYTSMLLGALTLLPAGIGAIEGIFVILLSEKNTSLHLATSVILFMRFISVWLLSAIGIIISLKYFSK